MNNAYALPSFSPRFLPVWRRNLLVWKKLAVPSILGNFLAQVPKNRGSAQVAYDNPKLATIAFDVEGIGTQFDDDLNSRVLPSYGVANLTVARTINRQVQAFFGVQNLFDKQYVVGTLPTTIGSPRLVNAGVRIKFSGQ